MADSNFYIDESTGEKKPLAGYPVLFELNNQKQFKTLRKSLKVSRPTELSRVEVDVLNGDDASASNEPIEVIEEPPKAEEVARVAPTEQVEPEALPSPPAPPRVAADVYAQSSTNSEVEESDSVGVSAEETPQPVAEEVPESQQPSTSEGSETPLQSQSSASSSAWAVDDREREPEGIEKVTLWAPWAREVQGRFQAERVLQTTACVSNVIFMDSRMSCRDALANFARLGISGAPVKDVGVVELFDVLALVVNQPHPSVMQRFQDPRRTTFLEAALDLPVVVAVCAASRYRRDEVTGAVRVSPGVTVAQAMSLLSKFWRFVIPGSPSHLVSQVSLMRYLYTVLPSLPKSFSECHASDTSAVIKKILYVEESTPTDMVMAAMVNHRVHVVAVSKVLPSGQTRLKAEISITSLEGYLTRPCSDFSLPVGDFLGQLRDSGLKPDKILTCHANVSIAKVVQLFALNEGSHHVWVTAGISKKLIGVITITSLLQSITGRN